MHESTTWTTRKGYQWQGEQLDFLIEIPNSQEILEAIQSFQLLKAPRTDGLYPIFYQKYWEIVENHIKDMCIGAFVEGKLPQGIKHTLIFLIQKTQMQPP